MTQKSYGSPRRLTSMTALAAVGALALSACGGSSSNSGTSGNAATGGNGSSSGFTFTYPQASAADPYGELAKKYTQETGVQITPKKMPNDSYQMSLRTQLQGGNAPDLILTAPGSGQDYSVLPLAKAQYLEPLTGVDTMIPEGSDNLVQADGKTYAMPTEIIPVGMLWQAGAAQTDGVTFPSDFEQLKSACATVAGQGKSFSVLAGSMPPNVGLMAMSVAATRVYAQTPDWNAQRLAGSVKFADSQGWKDTLQTILDMSSAGCFQKGFQGAGFDVLTKNIATGTSYSAFVPGSAAADIMGQAQGLTLTVNPFPPAAGGKEFIFASANYSLSINAKASAEAKKSAQDFLTWLAKPENAAAFAKSSGGVPIADADDLLPQYEPVKELLADKAYVPLPNTDWPNAKVYDALAKGTQGLLSGQGDIASVLTAMDTAWG